MDRRPDKGKTPHAFQECHTSGNREFETECAGTVVKMLCSND
jgi:hypothetical protein